MVTRTYVIVKFCSNGCDGSECPDTPAGKGHALQIRAYLVSLGVECDDEVTQRDHFGWEFSFFCEGSWFNLLLQSWESDQWLLILEPCWYIWHLSFWLGNDRSREAASMTLHSALHSEHALSHIRWFSKQEFERGDLVGHSAPIDSRQ